MDATRPYLDAYDDLVRRAPAPRWLERLREEGIDRFGKLGFPAPADEEWRSTNVSPIANTAFRLRGRAPAARIDLDALAPWTTGAPRLAFVDGQYAAGLSSLAGLPSGVTLVRLADAIATSPGLVEPHLGRHADRQSKPFVALNTAFIEDGLFLHAARAVLASTPLHVVFVSSGRESLVWHPRNLVVAEPGSQLSIVETWIGAGQEPYLNNPVTEVVALADASVEHVKLELDSERAFHVGALQTFQRRGSRVVAHQLSFGGALVRNDVDVALSEPNASVALNGLTVGGGAQHLDNHTSIEHSSPSCTSDELYKAILDGRAKGVFKGRIGVHPDAQKTDARQRNQNLLLSTDAAIDTRPQLEIHADDVKCTHGATVGQLDREAVFYLRSRGIGHAEARAMLTQAFAGELVERLRLAPLRRAVDERVLARVRAGLGGGTP